MSGFTAQPTWRPSARSSLTSVGIERITLVIGAMVTEDKTRVELTRRRGVTRVTLCMPPFQFSNGMPSQRLLQGRTDESRTRSVKVLRDPIDFVQKRFVNGHLNGLNTNPLMWISIHMPIHSLPGINTSHSCPARISTAIKTAAGRPPGLSG